MLCFVSSAIEEIPYHYCRIFTSTLFEQLPFLRNNDKLHAMLYIFEGCVGNEELQLHFFPMSITFFILWNINSIEVLKVVNVYFLVKSSSVILILDITKHLFQMKLNGAKKNGDLRCLHKKLIIVKCEQVHQNDVAKKN